MLSTLRRGSASTLALQLPRATLRVPRFFLSQHSIARDAQRQRSAPVRVFSSTIRFSQQAATRAQVVESEIEDEVNAQRPPTDEQIEEEIQYGPVTRFAELGERNMVAKSIVNTLTEGMGLQTMTQVQSMTINESLKGVDV